MPKNTPKTRARPDTKGAEPKAPSAAAIRSEKLRQDAAARGLKPLNFLAPTDSDSRTLIREVGDHLATLIDEDLATRRAQLRELLASPVTPEASGAKADVATLEALSGRSRMATPGTVVDPIAERLRKELRGRRDAWPILLEVLQSGELFEDVKLAKRRPDAIAFIRALLGDRQAHAAAMTAARDPSAVNLAKRIDGEPGAAISIIRMVLKIERSVRVLKARIPGLGRSIPRST